ncbi:MAG: phage tail terminator-like protein [Pararhizobium sp.]
MASAGVDIAVRARLAANWARCPVIDENGGDRPTDGSPFLVIQYPFSTAEPMSVGAPGANRWREEGAIRFVLEMERGSGTETGRQWCAELAALFRGKDFDGVQTWAPTSPVSDDDNDNGNYYTFAFVVPYQFDIIG